jgi:lipopolysaccharide export system protein LptC
MEERADIVPPHIRHHDWSARARTNAMQALRYSRFVVLAKRVLSLGAFLIIAAVLAFFFVARAPHKAQMTYEKLGRVENDLSMVQPRLTGADAKGNPFVITAEIAVQDANNPKRATLRHIEADLTLGDKTWLNVRANAGTVDMGTGQLTMTGGIDLFTDNGYTLHIGRAVMNLRSNTVRSNSEVTGHGPDGTLRADSFHADRNSGLLTLEGHVRMQFDATAT